MAKAIPAIITPEVLKWARELDAFSIEEAAKKMNTTPERIEQWEKGDARPTLNQAKRLAKIYRVPFVYFYLPDIPLKKKRLEKIDYRTIGNTGGIFYESRELRWLLRDIEDRRDIMIALLEEENALPREFPLHIDEKTDERTLASEIRELLEITPELQKTFRQPKVALDHCINILESHDVLVFQAAKISLKEMRGLSLAYERMPIIVVNRKDEPSARLFTLCHELVHIVTKTSGICNDTAENAESKFEIEMICNRVAGRVLITDEAIRKHTASLEIKKNGIDDLKVSIIARDFAVSRAVVIHRLWDINYISKETYFDTFSRYTEEYKASAEKKKNGFLPPAIDIGTQLGKLYSRTILTGLYSEKLTPRDASTCLLNLKEKNFSKLERWCF